MHACNGYVSMHVNYIKYNLGSYAVAPGGSPSNLRLPFNVITKQLYSNDTRFS